jgi:lambda repressor-like predicted transcriptional regulator
MTKSYTDTIEAHRQEVRLYGVTVEGMREAVEDARLSRGWTPEEIVQRLQKSAQQLRAQSRKYNCDQSHLDAAQAERRAGWITANYLTAENPT